MIWTEHSPCTESRTSNVLRSSISGKFFQRIIIDTQGSCHLQQLYVCVCGGGVCVCVCVCVYVCVCVWCVCARVDVCMDVYITCVGYRQTDRDTHRERQTDRQTNRQTETRRQRRRAHTPLTLIFVNHFASPLMRN